MQELKKSTTDTRRKRGETVTLPHETDWINDRKIRIEEYVAGAFRLTIYQRFGDLMKKRYEYRNSWRKAINRFERLEQQAHSLCA